MRIRLFSLVTLLLMGVSLASAQTTTTTTTTTAGPTVQIAYFACEATGVVNLSGTMTSGYDVYFQLFGGANGTGTALSGLRKAGVSGSYTFSEVVTYSGGTVAVNSVGSVAVRIARTDDPANTTYETTVNDVQDGCNAPQFPLGASSASDQPSADSAAAVTYTPIYAPDGGFLNPGYTPIPADTVVIGVRNTGPLRQGTPGLIFAECNQYPIANPGTVYDTDTVTLYWSWYAATAEQVQQHVEAVDYIVGWYGSNPLNREVLRSPIQQRGRNFWVFYTVKLDNLQPGFYPFSLITRWNAPIFDGFDSYGPGTGTEELVGNCDLTVTANPFGTPVGYDFP